MKRCCDRGQSGGQSFQNEHNPHPYHHRGKRTSFEFKGRETYLSDLLRPPGEVKILPPFPGFVVRHRLHHLFVDFGRRHRDRGESERILRPSFHRRHVRTHPITTGDPGGSGSGTMIFSRRRGGRSRPSRRSDE